MIKKEYILLIIGLIALLLNLLDIYGITSVISILGIGGFISIKILQYIDKRNNYRNNHKFSQKVRILENEI
jgi:hypothetical protein